MASENIPTVDLPKNFQPERVKAVEDFFNKTFGYPASFLVRAPGRVNLIGEHVDYCGYAVLPCAIEQDVLIAVGTKNQDSEKLCMVNLNSIYSSFNCSTKTTEVNKNKPEWYNYVICGFLGIKEHFKIENPAGMDLAIDGIIPPSAGLSSSSALVCAAALVTLHSNNLKLSRLELASLCAKCERYVGTEGGGMDQAICFLGEPGGAKLIEFNPLKVTDVILPSGHVFVIGNSYVEHNKAATSHYNTRVVECRLAAQIIAKSKNFEWKNVRRLVDIQNLLKVDLETMESIVKEVLHPEKYTRAEVCKLLDISEESLSEISLNPTTSNLQEFHLYQRALHVFSEANRVWKFKETCSNKNDHAAQTLGKLMNSSHESCRDNYECSHPQLDELVEICKTAGALGSRLTGAGWGGCTVSLVQEEMITDFVNEVKDKFYKRLGIPTNDCCFFVTQPSGGATIYKA